VKILVLAPFDAGELDRLRALGPVTYESWIDTHHFTSPDEIVERVNIEGYDVIVVEAESVTREVFEKAPGLRIVANTRGKPVQIDAVAATEHGCVVLQTPGRNADAVADLCIGMIIDRARHVSRAARAVVDGEWRYDLGEGAKPPPYLRFRGYELGGRLLGLIGLGAVGREVAARARGFKMRVAAYDPFLPEAEFARHGVERMELDDLLRSSDIVSIHVELSESTSGLLDARRLRLMKRGALLVNTARAKVADIDAITELVIDGHLGAVALDVFEPEPIPAGHPLLACEQALILPHIGGATEDVVRHHSEMIRDDLERLARGEPPLRCANPEVLDTALRPA
jgi:D-3-phosphoglycerate dehydrogenase